MKCSCKGKEDKRVLFSHCLCLLFLMCLKIKSALAADTAMSEGGSLALKSSHWFSFCWLTLNPPESRSEHKSLLSASLRCGKCITEQIQANMWAKLQCKVSSKTNLSVVYLQSSFILPLWRWRRWWKRGVSITFELRGEQGWWIALHRCELNVILI